MSFYARGTDSLWFFVELVTKNIDDFSFYKINFKVTGEWKLYKFPFSDWVRPSFSYGDISDLYSDSSLALAQKINWQISKTYPFGNMKGYLMIDNVSLFGIDSLPGNMKTTVLIPAKFKNFRKEYSIEDSRNYDLFGRTIFSERNSVPFCSGMYITRISERTSTFVKLKQH